MNRYVSLLSSISVFAATAAFSQEAVWVQIEAQPTLNEAQFRAQAYAGSLPQVNGFAMGSGWYAIALGPFTRQEAEALRLQYLRSGQIPADSYLADGGDYDQQFWPIGASPQGQVTGAPPAPSVDTTPLVDTADAEVPTETAPVPDPEPAIIDETPAQARQSEALLSAEERKALQVALKWAGFYDAAIDGAFGRGTRYSMGEWQGANGFDVTGILTTLQRAELLAQYNAVFDGLGFETLRDDKAGIQIDLPLGILTFDGYSAPFARYLPTGTPQAQVHLISEPGDRATLGGLYEIMQTLEIIPTDGERALSRDGFTIEGMNDRIHTYVEAGLEGGQIKGYAIVWPAGDEQRRSRVVERIQASFARLPGVLSGALNLEVEQSIDLVSGLAVRKPAFSRSGLWADDSGHVVTLAKDLDTCAEIHIDGEHLVDLTARDDANGLALLTPRERLTPPANMLLQQVPPRLQTEVAVAGYSFGGQLSAPSVTFGTLEDVRDLSGNEGQMRLSINTHDSDQGGPVLDMSGAVIGLLADNRPEGRLLPEGVQFAVDEAQIEAFLASNGISAATTAAVGRMEAEDLRLVAADLTTLIECWD